MLVGVRVEVWRVQSLFLCSVFDLVPWLLKLVK